MSDLEIPIRELHARTGHYVKKASERGRILVTHRGQPMAELRSLADGSKNQKNTSWKDRELLPAFASLMDQPVGGTESGLTIAQDRDRD